MKKIFFILFLSIVLNSFSQNLNPYKYAIIPNKFDFQKTKNQFNFSDLVKAGLKKYGFETYFNSDILPAECNDSNKFFVDINTESGIVYTKMTIVLKDYRNNILFVTEEAKTKEKEYDVAYNVVFREAIKSFERLNKKTADIKPTKLEPVASSQVFSDKYTAVKTKNGFNLITSNNDVFEIYNTSIQDVFIAKRNNICGVFLKKQEGYYFEYQLNDILQSEIIKVDLK